MNNQKMTLLIECPGIFPREISVNGQQRAVFSASIRDEFLAFDRMRYLMLAIINELDLDARTLNRIGFSKADAAELSMHIPGLDNVNPPRWEL